MLRTSPLLVLIMPARPSGNEELAMLDSGALTLCCSVRLRGISMQGPHVDEPCVRAAFDCTEEPVPFGFCAEPDPRAQQAAKMLSA